MEEYIDILVATYNGEKYIEEQINSLLNQTYKKIKIFISDDCSTDSTPSILEKYEKEYENIYVTYQKENLGFIRNFEFLLSKVEDEFYMLSDQDDVWYENKIEKSFKKLKDENADMVFSDLEVVDKNLKLISKSYNKIMKKDKKIRKSINKDDFEYLNNSITGCTILSKKSFIKYILPLPKNSKYVLHDYWIGLMLSFYGKIVYLDEATIKYRQHDNNQIGVKKKKYANFHEIRTFFIDMKKDLFNTYLENESKFPDKFKKMNANGKKYFDEIENKKYFNFKGWSTFHKLYKNEGIRDYSLNFIILNMPIMGKPLFKIYKIKNGY